MSEQDICMIHYKISFLDYWHMGSGLSGGAKLDSSVIKDINKLPFVPGKTLKGLLREEAILKDEKEFISECFGDEGKYIGKCHFSNAVLGKKTQENLIQSGFGRYLFDQIASTAIDPKTGMAQDDSLREIEVTKPVSLYGSVANIPLKFKEKMQICLLNIKRMGLNRNRGLGRCKIEIMEGS